MSAKRVTKKVAELKLPKLRSEYDLVIDMERLELFKGIFTILKDMVDDVTIEFSASGMRFITMDRNHVALVQCMLPTSAFMAYNCGQESHVCINVAEMVKILACGNDSDMLRITYKTTSKTPDSGTLKVNIYGSCKLSFTVGTMVDEAMQELELPTLESFPINLTINSTHLATACKNLRTFGEHVDISFSEKGMELVTKGIKTQKAAFTIPLDDCSRCSYTGSFSLDQMIRILKGSTLKNPGSMMRLLLNPDMPLCALYDFSGGQLKFFLAPRVDE